MHELKLGGRHIGDKFPTYIIAEVGLAHQGSLKMAKKLIDVAVEAGCDCVKFQKRSLPRREASGCDGIGGGAGEFPTVFADDAGG